MKLFKVDSGHYFTDGGAMMGVNPWALWGKKEPTDERRRIRLALDLLLIVGQGRVILVDSGIGNRLNEKQEKIYRPSEFILEKSLAELGYKAEDVTDVILSHLHFDHAGGLISACPEGERPTFPQAQLWIQKIEWEMAKHPDGLNQAAYNYAQQLQPLEGQVEINLVDGDATIAPGVKVKKTGGHTVGSQIVEIEAEDGFYIYPADIIPTVFHVPLAITSAYDVNRKETYSAKQYIHETIRERGGKLLLNHDNQYWEYSLS
ncbi:MAG TPA: MBL fold metallo-hydrolase [Candidatus Cloacimonetes bacterium]|jgi:glyoxylase-like metal-dependent hydrolase (beta-lactamase superfamily II)|nr:MBL fold metallo-hydrolase [Candidatus Cloacimonadota bacterium]